LKEILKEMAVSSFEEFSRHFPEVNGGKKKISVL